MKSIVKYFIVSLFCGFVALMMYGLYELYADCTANGGVMVRAVFGYECVLLERAR